MKKAYTKPGIVFDNFELSQSIAGSCEYISNQAYGTCGVFVEGFNETIFTSTTNCNRTPANEADKTPGNINYNGVCYDVPAPDSNVFSS